ncbi:MAG: DUF2914 domain-containing protein [Psychromonas sp.]|nr:DUF2914 domain-containing protein [Psychromonas sp.]
MNAPKKLNIYIRFTSQKTIATEESGYIYHWHRIIGSALLLISTVSISVYAAYNYLHQSDMATQNAAKAAIKNSSPSADTNLKNSILLTTKKKSTVNEAVQDKSRTAPLFTQAEVQIFSKHIKRFVIAKTVKGREPLGSINEISFKKDHLATVYAYSHAVGLKDETLYYKWRLNRKKLAQVKVSIGSNHWRSYSTKFIQPQMEGEWSVTLENAKGEILAINRFHYLQ